MTDLPAGDFSAWLTALGEALDGRRDSNVPCNGCTACCTASQFIHVGPEETDALAHIPSELLVPAPLSPPGHMVMGYDAHGSCPMLVEGKCTIYAHRPRACRTYDCRVFAAAGIDANDPQVAERARRWRFGHPTERDRADHAAVRAEAAAATAEAAWPNNTQAAVAAVRVVLGRSVRSADAPR